MASLGNLVSLPTLLSTHRRELGELVCPEETATSLFPTLLVGRLGLDEGDGVALVNIS